MPHNAWYQMIACKPLTLSGTAEVPLLPRADSAVHQDEHTHTSQSLEESCVFYSQALLVIEMSAHVSRTWLKKTPLSHTQTLLVIEMSAHVSRTWCDRSSSSTVAIEAEGASWLAGRKGKGAVSARLLFESEES